MASLSLSLSTATPIKIVEQARDAVVAILEAIKGGRDLTRDQTTQVETTSRKLKEMLETDVNARSAVSDLLSRLFTQISSMIASSSFNIKNADKIRKNLVEFSKDEIISQLMNDFNGLKSQIARENSGRMRASPHPLPSASGASAFKTLPKVTIEDNFSDEETNANTREGVLSSPTPRLTEHRSSSTQPTELQSSSTPSTEPRSSPTPMPLTSFRAPTHGNAVAIITRQTPTPRVGASSPAIPPPPAIQSRICESFTDFFKTNQGCFIKGVDWNLYPDEMSQDDLIIFKGDPEGFPIPKTDIEISQESRRVKIKRDGKDDVSISPEQPSAFHWTEGKVKTYLHHRELCREAMTMIFGLSSDPIQGDGNCLPVSLRTAYLRLEENKESKEDEIPDTSVGLRLKMLEEMLKKADKFKSQFGIKTTDRWNKILESVIHDKSFIGEEACQAFSNLYNVNIYVWRWWMGEDVRDHDIETYQPTTPSHMYAYFPNQKKNSVDSRSIHLFFWGKHYDSLKLEPNADQAIFLAHVLANLRQKDGATCLYEFSMCGSLSPPANQPKKPSIPAPILPDEMKKCEQENTLPVDVMRYLRLGDVSNLIACSSGESITLTVEISGLLPSGATGMFGPYSIKVEKGVKASFVKEKVVKDTGFIVSRMYLDKGMTAIIGEDAEFDNDISLTAVSDHRPQPSEESVLSRYGVFLNVTSATVCIRQPISAQTQMILADSLRERPISDLSRDWRIFLEKCDVRSESILTSQDFKNVLWKDVVIKEGLTMNVMRWLRDRSSTYIRRITIQSATLDPRRDEITPEMIEDVCQRLSESKTLEHLQWDVKWFSNSENVNALRDSLIRLAFVNRRVKIFSNVFRDKDRAILKFFEIGHDDYCNIPVPLAVQNNFVAKQGIATTKGLFGNSGLGLIFLLKPSVSGVKPLFVICSDIVPEFLTEFVQTNSYRLASEKDGKTLLNTTIPDKTVENTLKTALQNADASDATIKGVVNSIVTGERWNIPDFSKNFWKWLKQNQKNSCMIPLSSSSKLGDDFWTSTITTILENKMPKHLKDGLESFSLDNPLAGDVKKVRKAIRDSIDHLYIVAKILSTEMNSGETLGVLHFKGDDSIQPVVKSIVDDLLLSGAYVIEEMSATNLENFKKGYQGVKDAPDLSTNWRFLSSSLSLENKDIQEWINIEKLKGEGDDKAITDDYLYQKILERHPEEVKKLQDINAGKAFAILDTGRYKIIGMSSFYSEGNEILYVLGEDSGSSLIFKYVNFTLESTMKVDLSKPVSIVALSENVVAVCGENQVSTFNLDKKMCTGIIKNLEKNLFGEDVQVPIFHPNSDKIMYYGILRNDKKNLTIAKSKDNILVASMQDDESSLIKFYRYDKEGTLKKVGLSTHIKGIVKAMSAVDDNLYVIVSGYCPILHYKFVNDEQWVQNFDIKKLPGKMSEEVKKQMLWVFPLSEDIPDNLSVLSNEETNAITLAELTAEELASEELSEAYALLDEEIKEEKRIVLSEESQGAIKKIVKDFTKNRHDYQTSLKKLESQDKKFQEDTRNKSKVPGPVEIAMKETLIRKKQEEIEDKKKKMEEDFNDEVKEFQEDVLTRIVEEQKSDQEENKDDVDVDVDVQEKMSFLTRLKSAYILDKAKNLTQFNAKNSEFEKEIKNIQVLFDDEKYDQAIVRLLEKLQDARKTLSHFRQEYNQAFKIPASNQNVETLQEVVRQTAIEKKEEEDEIKAKGHVLSVFIAKLDLLDGFNDVKDMTDQVKAGLSSEYVDPKDAFTYSKRLLGQALDKKIQELTVEKIKLISRLVHNNQERTRRVDNALRDQAARDFYTSQKMGELAKILEILEKKICLLEDRINLYVNKRTVILCENQSTPGCLLKDMTFLSSSPSGIFICYKEGVLSIKQNREEAPTLLKFRGYESLYPRTQVKKVDMTMSTVEQSHSGVLFSEGHRIFIRPEETLDLPASKPYYYDLKTASASGSTQPAGRNCIIS